MEEAYKLLSSPSSTGVSDAAKGIKPENMYQEEEEDDEEHTERLEGDHPTEDIREAYAMLFESLAVIMKNK